VALPAVAARHGQIDEAIFVEVRRHNAGRRGGGNRDAGCCEPAATFVEAHVARARTVRCNDVEPAIAIEIRNRRIPRRPFRDAPRSDDCEAALPVIEVDELLIGSVVAGEHVEIVVAVQIGERRSVGAIRRRAEIRCREAPFPIVDQHAIENRRVTALGQYQVEIAVAVEIPHAHVRGVLGRLFELNDGRKGTRWRLDAQRQHRDEGPRAAHVCHRKAPFRAQEGPACRAHCRGRDAPH
jgi:hypothetical protein